MNWYKNYKKHFNVYENAQISDFPSENLGIIVIIPSYNEFYTHNIVNNLLNCKSTQCDVEIIVVVNAKQNSEQDVVNRNINTLNQINRIAQSNKNKKIKVYTIYQPDMPKKHAGVGLARKIGMDTAVKRFDSINKNGIIVNIDADCNCNYEYLFCIEKFFNENKNINSISIEVEHPIQGDEFNQQTYDAIAKYELYLRYYIAAQKYCNLPFAYQTIGSAFAVKAETYCLEGGMNKRQAGEDFYFLQKIIAKQHHAHLKEAVVYPSPRLSNRVPFGTGNAIATICKDNNYLVYNPLAFEIVKHFIENINLLPQNIIPKNINSILLDFLNENNFQQALENMNQNSCNQSTFNKRFYTWFDAFRLLKFLNFAHLHYIEKIPIETAAAYIASKLFPTKQIPTTATELLIFYRQFL